MKWKVALVCPSVYGKETSREDNLAIVMSHICAKGKMIQREEPRIMENYCQTPELNPNQWPGSLCLSEFQNYNGPVTIVHFYFSFPFFPFLPPYSIRSFAKESVCNTEDPGSIPGSGRSARERRGYPPLYSWASLVAQLVKNPLALWETWVQSLG